MSSSTGKRALGKLVAINARNPTGPDDFAALREARTKSVLLIAPTSTHAMGMTKWLSINLGIERLAAHVRVRGHYAETYDVNMYKSMGVGNGTDKLTLEEKLQEHPWDIIGFSVYEATMINDIENMMLAKKLCPKAIIICGGHAAQFNYQLLLDKSPCRAVVLGEGERPLAALLDGTPIENIPGIVIKNTAIPLSTEEFQQVTENIDYEAMPYEMFWDYYLNLYRQNGQEITPELSKTIHTIRIYTRNYCPMNCKFCSSTNWLSFAAGRGGIPIADYTGVQLVNLLKRIIKAHPRAETFYFTDDEFCIMRDKLLEFLHAMIEADLPVTLICFSRIDDLDPEIIGLMAKAKFRVLNIGVESFQEEILREYHKGLTVEHINNVFDCLEENGIRPSCSFILVSPEAKLEWVENVALRILDEIERKRIYAGVNIAVEPQAGAGLFEEYCEFEIQRHSIPGTGMFLKQYHFVKAMDPEVREFQYRFLFRWAGYIEDVLSKAQAHFTSQFQSIAKLKLVLELVDEIRGERGQPDRFRYTNRPQDERTRCWKVLEHYSYGASL